MEDELAPLAGKALLCIEPDRRFFVLEDDEEPWKLVFLIFIVLKCILSLIGTIDQRRLLANEELLVKNYDTLPEKLKEHESIEKLKQVR